MKTLTYEFMCAASVGINAPAGTNPDSLTRWATIGFIDKLKSDEAIVICEKIIDPDTGFKWKGDNDKQMKLPYFKEDDRVL